MASKSDDDMIARLNGNLDVLLIFAGLFSAVNTAFIVVALNILSAGPADQTNHLLRLLLTNGTSRAFTSDDLAPPSFRPTTAAVRQNCLFFASLACSLLAAAGTVLAKQWLQYYQRTGQTGPIREQAMKRTEKFLGAESWALSRVVESLPALLQISLVLFFAAMVDYLWGINRPVAIVMLAFASVGLFAYGFTVVVSAMNEACPFQSPFSRYLRDLYRTGQNLPKDAWEIFGHRRTRVSQAMARGRAVLHGLTGTVSTWLRQTRVRIHDGDTRAVFDALSAPLLFYRPITSAITTSYLWTRLRLKQKPSQSKEILKNAHDSFIYTRSAIWMAQTAPEQDNIMTIAQNIPFISHLESTRLIAPSEAFSGLLYWFRSSLVALQSDQTTTQIASTVTLAKAVAHVVLADPGRTAEAVRKIFENVGSLKWLLTLCGKNMDGLEELMVLLNSISIVFRPHRMSRKLISIEDTLRKGLQRTTRKGAAATIHLHCLILSAPSNTSSREDVQHQIDAISETLLPEGVNADAAYVSCAALALSLTIRALPIPRDFPLETQPHPFGREGEAWAARTQDSISVNLLNGLDAFAKYYVYARHSSPPQEIYTPLLQCQTQLLVHAKAVRSSNDLTPQQTRPQRTTWFQKMHTALNVNIREVLTIDKRALHPHIEPLDLRICLDTLVDSLRDLLLTPGSQWSKVDTSHLETTARWARRLGSKEDKLSEAILYRYFVHIEKIFYSTLPSNERRRPRLVRDRRVGSVLISAFRLYLWLYSAIAPERRWRTFGSYLLFLATGERQTEDPDNLFDWIPNEAVEDAWDQEEQTPTISTAFHTRGYRPSVMAPSRNNTLAEAVEETVAGTYQEGEIDTYSLMGPGMLWLAESLRCRDDWAGQFDEKRMVRLFVGVSRQAMECEEGESAELDMWSSVDLQGAGTLFLRAWEAKTASSSITSSNPSGSPNSDSPGWTSDSAIEAFAHWLPTFDYHGSIMIKDKNDDVVMLQTSIDLGLILQFIDHASTENSDAAKKFGLNKARQELVQGPLTPVARTMINPWRERKYGSTPVPLASKSDGKRMPSKKGVAFKDKPRPPPLRAPPGGQLRLSQFAPDGTDILMVSESPDTADFKTAV
ncbi:hypothetical protein FRB97_008098 [Tulasnella sp. 331]|nr:hypothetical protein FRB97_008098 [Tulasnella sp. 331]